MEPMIAKLVEMRANACEGSVSRRLADRCLELCFQEIVANDELFSAPPLDEVEDWVQTVLAGMR